MRGGSSNRIVGVSVAGDERNPVVERFVIRVPRFEGDDLDDLAPLQLLRQQSTFPTPEVVQFDRTTSNPLGRAYMILKRLSGSSLWPSYFKMTHQQRSMIAQSLGKAFAEMHSTISTVPGKIIFSASHEYSHRGSLMIQPLEKQRTDITVPYKSGPASKTIFDTICAIIEHQKELLIFTGPDDGIDLGFFSQW
ncbi:hypothetical protein N7488_000996 [Penicillium malachiteum]|nr:hypothetical protein N7488_000996 [Penicillium malachiteum]